MITGPRSSDLHQELNLLLYDMREREQDLVISVYGREGSGKSRWAMNLAALLDDTFNGETLVNKTAQTIQDFGRLAPKTEPFKVCWWDEAHRFSKRGQYDTSVNRDLLEYFQDIRGGKKIFILCYPQIEEIDRKIVERSRMFFETAKKGGTFFVKAWTHKQISIKVRELRLPSPATRAKLWMGTSKKPMAIYGHDAKNIEGIIEAYKGFKANSVRMTDERLAQKYGYRGAMDIAIAVWGELQQFNIDISFDWLQRLASLKLNERLEEGWDIQQDGKRWKVYNDNVFDNIVKEVVYNVRTSSKNILNNIEIIPIPQYNHNILPKEVLSVPQIKKEVLLVA